MTHYEFLEFINKNYAQDYTEKAERVHQNAELLEAVIGLSGESGEVLDLMKKHIYYGTKGDNTKLLNELGDVFHYFMRIVCLTGNCLEDVMLANKRKLEARFPNGYSDAAAIARVDVK